MGLSRQKRRVVAGRLVGDVCARMADAHDQHRSLGQLRRSAVVLRMKLPNRRVELDREGGHVRMLECTGGDNHVRRLEDLAVVGSDHIAVVGCAKALTATPSRTGRSNRLAYDSR